MTIPPIRHRRMPAADLSGSREPEPIRRQPSCNPIAHSRLRDDRGLALCSRALVLRRRSALAFDGESSIDRDGFLRDAGARDAGRRRTMGRAVVGRAAFTSLFVHRVDGVEPGVYLLARDPSAVDRLKAACGREFLWEPVGDGCP